MFRGAAWAIAVCALYATPAHASGVYLEAGTLTATIGELLRLEGRTVAHEVEDADIRATIGETERTLEVSIVSRAGTPILERSINRDRGLEAALRVAVLLLVEALAENEVRAPPPPPPPPAPSAAPVELARAPGPVSIARPELQLELAAGAALSRWSSPDQITPGLHVSARIAFPFLRAGMGLIAGGCHLAFLGDCAKTIPGLITLDDASITVLAELEVPVLELGPLELGALAAGGVSSRSLESRALLYEREATEAMIERREAIEGVALLGVVADASIGTSPIHLRLSGGASARFSRLTVRVGTSGGHYLDEDGEPLVFSQDPIDPGVFSPWVELGAAVRLF